MERDGQTLVLNTQEELDTLWAGADIVREPGEYISSQLEDDLVYAAETHTTIGNGVVRVSRKEEPDFHFSESNIGDAKEALESVLAQKGLKGLWLRIRGRKHVARIVLTELAIAEEFTREA